VGVWVRLP